MSKADQHCAKNIMEISQLFLLTLLKQSFINSTKAKPKTGVKQRESQK